MSENLKDNMKVFMNITLKQMPSRNGTKFFVNNQTAVNVAMTWFSLMSCPATLLLNGILITAIASRAELRTGFNLYIANIALTDVCVGLTNMPGTFLSQYRNHGYLLNPVSCTVLVCYGAYTLGGVNRWAHVLVAVNRLWALTFPLCYRQRHTRRVALLLVMAIWVLIHALSLPVVIRGRMKPAEQSCRLDVSQQRKYAFVQDLICFSVPLVLIPLMYSFIVVKMVRRKRRKQVNPAGNQGNAAAVEAAKSVARRSKERVLMYLVILLVVCWTPSKVYWHLVELADYWDTTFLAVQFFGQFAHHWISPILCYLAMDDLRRRINQMLRCQ
ncbi:hypothetical protein BV898_05971 [Hypsibius exemplaris]|uniref:G-protein coupled receptors family 1 profile domain-containing protein n=1 Tax=Hypsibius exemplaris TaxID=2072580 RepID=A0A1W0WXS1_HYPEX|nr:hypothetical protein BV898_05971 [Hypsibius exemplaris]